MNALTKTKLREFRATEDVFDRGVAVLGEERVAEILIENGCTISLTDFRARLSNEIARAEVGALWWVVGPNEKVFRCEKKETTNAT